jgi:hypothetical protein
MSLLDLLIKNRKRVNKTRKKSLKSIGEFKIIVDKASKEN